MLNIKMEYVDLPIRHTTAQSSEAELKVVVKGKIEYVKDFEDKLDDFIKNYSKSTHGKEDAPQREGRSVHLPKDTEKYTTEELKDWTEEWEEGLYNREYECLPSGMQDILYEYFDNGGTASEYNKTLELDIREDNQNSVKKLVVALYEEYCEGE